MAATKRHMNWTNVAFSNTNCTGVTQVSVDHGVSVQAFSGDGDKFVTTRVQDFRDPSVSVTTADLAWVNAAAVASRATLTCTHKDAKLAANSDITYTLSNAVATTANTGGAHRAFGSGSITFAGESSDGSTSPLAVS